MRVVADGARRLIRQHLRVDRAHRGNRALELYLGLAHAALQFVKRGELGAACLKRAGQLCAHGFALFVRQFGFELLNRLRHRFEVLLHDGVGAK